MPHFDEHVLELRYKPNSKILDYRGSWAEVISEHIELPRWSITENRIDIYVEDGDRAFVSFRNAGYVSRDTPTKSYFRDKSLKFLRYLFSLDGFGKTLHVERLGVRSKFLKKYDGSFDELKENYASKYLGLTDKAKEILAATIVDIGGSVNFADRYGNFNTMSGPMLRDQISQFFDRKGEIPELGLFFDIDYWLAPNGEMGDKDILSNIDQFANSTWDKFEKISNLIFGK